MDLPLWLPAILIVALGAFAIGYVLIRRAPLYDDVQMPERSEDQRHKPVKKRSIA